MSLMLVLCGSGKEEAVMLSGQEQAVPSTGQGTMREVQGESVWMSPNYPQYQHELLSPYPSQLFLFLPPTEFCTMVGP